jgi:hypothetical protein
MLLSTVTSVFTAVNLVVFIGSGCGTRVVTEKAIQELGLREFKMKIRGEATVRIHWPDL